MKYTNKHNLTQSICNAVINDPYRLKGHISASGVILPPRIRQLEARHTDEITVDVSERIFPLLGSNTHYIIERAGGRDSFQEETLTCKVLNWTVSGTADDYSEPGIISDYKVTSIWSVLNGVKPEWEQQNNIYAYLYQLAGFPVTELQIIAIMRDWSKPRSMREQNYPETQVEVLPVQLWSFDDQKSWLYSRVEIHQYAEKLPDNKLPLCTPDEMWEKPTTYAVKKNNNKRARKVLTTLNDAENVKAVCEERHPKDKWFIETRPGERTRCEYYCSVKDFCNQYKKHKEELNEHNS